MRLNMNLLQPVLLLLKVWVLLFIDPPNHPHHYPQIKITIQPHQKLAIPAASVLELQSKLGGDYHQRKQLHPNQPRKRRGIK